MKQETHKISHQNELKICAILKIEFKIRNQRHRIPPIRELCENRRVSKISCPPYWIRYFEKWKSDVKFVIRGLKIRKIPKIRCPQNLLSTEFRGNRVVSKIACPTYWTSAILRRVWLFEIGEAIFFLQFNYFDHR